MTIATFTRTEQGYLFRLLTFREAEVRHDRRDGRLRPSEAAMELVTIDELRTKILRATER